MADLTPAETLREAADWLMSHRAPEGLAPGITWAALALDARGDAVGTADVTLRDLLREAWRIAPLWRIQGEIGYRTWRWTNRRDNVEVKVWQHIDTGRWTVEARQRGTTGAMAIKIGNPTVEAVAAAARLCGSARLSGLATVDRGEAT